MKSKLSWSASSAWSAVQVGTRGRRIWLSSYRSFQKVAQTPSALRPTVSWVSIAAGAMSPIGFQAATNIRGRSRCCITSALRCAERAWSVR